MARDEEAPGEAPPAPSEVQEALYLEAECEVGNQVERFPAESVAGEIDASLSHQTASTRSPSAEEEPNSDAAPPARKRKGILLTGVILALCLVAVAVGLAVALTGRSDDDSPSSSSTTSTGGPMDDIPDPRDPVLLRQIRFVFQQEEWSDINAWLDPTSPQSRALDQITEEYYDFYVNDQTASGATADLSSMLASSPNKWEQRYALWVLAFANGIRQDEIPLDECSWMGRVQCDNGSEAIRSVIFDDMGLKGTLPEEVGLWIELGKSATRACYAPCLRHESLQ